MHQKYHSRCVMWFKGLCNAPTLQLQGKRPNCTVYVLCDMKEDKVNSHFQVENVTSMEQISAESVS